MTQRSTLVRRMAAVGAGVILMGSAWTGTALADDDPVVPSVPISIPSVAVPTGSSSSGSSSDGVLPKVEVPTAVPTGEFPLDADVPGSTDLTSSSSTSSTTPTTTTSGSTTTTTSASNVCTQLIGQLTGLFTQFSTVSGQLAGLDPTGVLGTSLTTQLAGLQSQITSVSSQLANNPLCTATGTGTGGSTGTVPTYNPSSGKTDYSVRYPWNYGHRYYDKGYRYPDVQVETTQVRTVPKGGVDTGDGSF